MKTTVQIMYWSDIPVQIKVKKGRFRLSQELSSRFQVAIDKAAMEAGLVGSDSYTDQFHWSDSAIVDGEPDEVLKAVAADIERRFEVIDWRNTVKLLKEKDS